MADMATETQDVRMPVRVETQPDGREINVSEKFEVGRNFCNKLWNAARFAFLNLESAPYSELDPVSLPIEDRWILSRLSSSVSEVHRALSEFQFSRALNLARVFFRDELCDWYLELVKSRIADDRQADAARQILACCLDQTLRLLHPFVPFITERLWRQLNEVAPERGLPGRIDCPSSAALVTASFPPTDGWPALVDPALTEAFEHLQEVTRGVRDVRMRHNVSPRELLNVTVKPAPESVEPMRRAAHIVKKLARIGELTVDAEAVRPPNAASVVVGSVQIFVLDCVDEGAEAERIRKEVGEVDKLIAGKEKKLSNAGFVDRAPSEVVQRERERLAELHSRRKNLSDTLAMMQKS
jgi:valyl-tRNA synthetase